MSWAFGHTPSHVSPPSALHEGDWVIPLLSEAEFHFHEVLLGYLKKKKNLPRECFSLILCVTHGHLLFSCRLQQQRSEDGMQKTWAQCQLQRAGLAGSEHFIIILSPNTHLWYCKSSQSISLGLVWYSNQCLLTASCATPIPQKSRDTVKH